MINLGSIVSWLGSHLLNVLYTLFDIHIQVGDLSVNFVYLIFGGLLFSAVISFIGKAVARG